MSLGFAEVLRERGVGIVALSDNQISLLQGHYELLLKWNKTLNLTRITDVRDAVERHYLESLFLGAQLPDRALRIADIGSGGGFPGFPVAVLRPDCNVTLIESHQRKAVFLREASRDVGNVRVLAVRVEEVHEEFDWAISRAVSYEDLHGPLRGMAGCAALLTGGEEPPPAWNWRWKPAIRVPGARSRFLRLGALVSRETVPRETQK